MVLDVDDEGESHGHCPWPDVAVCAASMPRLAHSPPGLPSRSWRWSQAANELSALLALSESRRVWFPTNLRVAADKPLQANSLIVWLLKTVVNVAVVVLYGVGVHPSGADGANEWRELRRVKTQWAPEGAHPEERPMPRD